MLYNEFPNIGVNTSALGFGCMRLPVQDGHINEDEAIRMIRHAIDSGVTYIDTAWPYHSGESEIVVGKALRDGYRERVKLITKLPCWEVKCHEDMMAKLDRQLEKLQTDHLDFYLLHALDINRYHEMKSYDFASFFDEAMAQGKVLHPAFSFHDNYDAFHEIVNDYPWHMAQVQMNILDDMSQATLAGIREAGEKGVGIVIMEPLRGGLMANPPAEVQAIYDAFPVKRSAVEWAFRYLYTMPEVCTILSGMSTMDQVVDNLRIFDAAACTPLSEEEKQLYADVKEAYMRRVKTRCTGCKYCQPCPMGVKIPNIFQNYDRVLLRGEGDFGKVYNDIREHGGDASRCVECRQCESACPQHLPITRYLKEIDSEFSC